MLNNSTWFVGMILALLLCYYPPMTGQEIDTTVWFPSLSVTDQQLIGPDTDSISLDNLGGSLTSVAEILRREANVYFRDFGPGSSSTISLAGSRSNEVALIWNGIKISNPMLGVNDYSLISPAGLTGLRIAKPGNATIFGAGSSAGAIILDQNLNSEKKPIEIAAGWSSLQNLHLQAGYTHQKGSWKSKTSISGMTGQNNYKYTTLSGNKDRLPHARSKHLNFSHHSVVDIKSNQHLSFSIWARDHFREIPPSLTEARSEADQSDRFFRALAGFNHLQAQHKWHFKAYYGLQNQIYRNPLINLHANHVFQNFQGRMDNQWEINQFLFLKYGLRTSLFASHSDNYQEQNHQNRWAMYSQLRYKIPEFPLEFTALLQPEWVSGLVDKPSPGWTMEAKIKYANKKWGQWAAFLNQNMVWPTLNDLHWNPGGNPDLQPEQNRMTGLSWKREWPRGLSHTISYYAKWGTNWIQWAPSDLGFWRPFNAVEGSIHSINLELSKNWGSHLDLTGGYQFVHSTTADEKTTYQQAIYSPRHMWSVRAQYHISPRWTFWVIGEYTSTRFVTKDHSQSLDPYFLCHSAVMYQFKNPSWKLGLEVTNLMGVEYQGIINRPMPGRQIQLNTYINFK